MTDQPAPDAPVVHEPARRRFVLRDAGAEAELVYRVDDRVMTLVHTGVPGPPRDGVSAASSSGPRSPTPSSSSGASCRPAPSPGAGSPATRPTRRRW